MRGARGNATASGEGPVFWHFFLRKGRNNAAEAEEYEIVCVKTLP